MQLSSKDILISVMKTPNPLALKLVVNFLLKKQGKADFKSKDELDKQPLFRKLFSISGVKRIHIFENQITLSHDGSVDFDHIAEESKKIIKQLGSNHNPDFLVSEEKEKKKERNQLSEIHRKAEEILDRTIRPSLQADGGGVEIKSFKDDKVEIVYQGACGGCPSSYLGTLEAIQSTLRYELQNENLEVYPVDSL